VRLDTDEPAQALVLVEPPFDAALNPAPLAVRVTHAVHAFEELAAAFEVLAKLVLHLREIVGVHEHAPLGNLLRLRVAEHRAPARREIHRVVTTVIVPQAVVRGIRDEAVALLDRRELLLQPNALEPRRAADADELQREMQVRAPLGADRRRADTEHAAELAADVEADDEQRADVQARELRGVVALQRVRRLRVAGFEQAQMAEPRLDPGKVAERAASQHFGAAGRERRATRVDLVEVPGFGIEQRDEDGVRAADVGQRLEARDDALLEVVRSDALEVDGDLRAGQIEAGLAMRQRHAPLGPHRGWRFWLSTAGRLVVVAFYRGAHI